MSKVRLYRSATHRGDASAIVDCSCGVRGRIVPVSSLERGYTRSCGCIRTEQTIDRNRLRRGGSYDYVDERPTMTPEAIAAQDAAWYANHPEEREDE